MNFFFLCSSLELGRDGVGDYTNRLAIELLALGHSCQCVAINDLYLSNNFEHSCTQKNLYRLPTRMSWHKRIQFIQNTISKCKPDMVSLQYVPYGYSSKGLPILLPDKLSSIRGNFKWHLMFHELWVEPIGLYRKFISAMQRRIVSSLCRKLTPVVVHTSNPTYSDKLAQAGISASVLPLFSNIDKAQPNTHLRSQLIQNSGFRANDDEVWMFVFFGSIHPGWECRSFLERVSKAARLTRKAGVIFISIGKNQGKGAEIWNSMQAVQNNNYKFLCLGELPAVEISQHLQACDFGVATTPVDLLGKSGTAAAFSSHCLPIIVPRLDLTNNYHFTDNNGVVKFDEFFEQNLNNPRSPQGFFSPRQVADRFVEQNSAPYY